MLEGKSIALMIFTVLNVAGNWFLPVRAFAISGRKGISQSPGAARSAAERSGLSAVSQDVVVCAPMAAAPRRENGRLIRFPARAGNVQPSADGNGFAAPRPARSKMLAR